MRGVTARVRCQFRRRDRTNFESVKDREVDHGEEEEGEETVHQKEGRSGPQATEGNEGGGEAVDQEDQEKSALEGDFGELSELLRTTYATAQALSPGACRQQGIVESDARSGGRSTRYRT